MDWWEEARTLAPRRVYTVRPVGLRTVWACVCGREFTSSRGRGSHRSRCAVYRAVRDWQLARFLDSLDAARTRVAAARSETRDTPA